MEVIVVTTAGTGHIAQGHQVHCKCQHKLVASRLLPCVVQKCCKFFLPQRPCESDKLILPAVQLTDIVVELCKDFGLLKPLLRVGMLHSELVSELVLDSLNKQSHVALAEVASSQNSAAYLLRSVSAAHDLEELEQVCLPLFDRSERNDGSVEQVHSTCDALLGLEKALEQVVFLCVVPPGERCKLLL